MLHLVLLLVLSSLNLALTRPSSPLSIIRPGTDMGVSRRPSNGTWSPTTLYLTADFESTTALNSTRFSAVYPPGWDPSREYLYEVPQSTIMLECSFPEMHEELNRNTVMSLLERAMAPFMNPADAREPVGDIKPASEDWYWTTEAEDGTSTIFEIVVPDDPPVTPGLNFGQMKDTIGGIAWLARGYPNLDISCGARDVGPGGHPPNFPVIASPYLFWYPYEPDLRSATTN